MRILVLSQYWKPENGVVQRRWEWISDLLNGAGHELIVITPHPSYRMETNLRSWLRNGNYKSAFDSKSSTQKLTVVRSGSFPAGISLTSRVFNQASVALGIFGALHRLRRSSSWGKVDKVVATVPAIPTAFVAFVVAKILRVPYVIDLRDAWPELLNYRGEWNRALGRKSPRERISRIGGARFLTVVTGKLLIRVLREASGIIVTSRSLGTDLVSKYGIDEERIEVVRNVFPNHVVLTKANNDQEPKFLRVLYAGTVGRAQNLRNAVEAVKISKEQGIPIELTIIGDGAARTALESEVEEAGLNVNFLGQTELHLLNEYYRTSDTALVHLTDWKPLESAVPSKTYELMEAGVHISAVVAGETAELVKRLGAGNVASPESPKELASLWRKLFEGAPHSLVVHERAVDWVRNERQIVAPESLFRVFAEDEDSRLDS